MTKLTLKYALVIVFILASIIACKDSGTDPKTDGPDPIGPQPIQGNLPADYDPTNFEIDFPDTWDYHSRWSPDGNYIAFTKYDHTECQNWLYKVSTGDLTPPHLGTWRRLLS